MLAVCCAVCVALSAARPADARAPLRVRGAASIEAAATPLDGLVEVRGLLRDDAGRPIANARLGIELRDGQNGPPLRLSKPQACPPNSDWSVGRTELPDWYEIDTDSAGGFCVRMSDVGPPGVLRLHFEDPRELLDPAERWLSLDNLRRTLDLRFTPEPTVLPLERAAQTFAVETRLRPALNGEPELPISVELHLESAGSARRELAKKEISAGERVEFRIDTKELGPPGPATLTASFPGSHAVQPGATSVVLLRTSLVALELPNAVAAGGPSDGITLPITVTSAAGGSPTGTVEARLGQETVGIAAIRDGRAELYVAFEPPSGARTTDLELRYLPDAPWWVPGAPRRVTIPILPPSPWRRVPWLLAALLVGAWVIASWRRPIRTERKREEERPVRQAEPAVRLVEARDRDSGWAGRVVDAHDGVEIAGAQISIRKRVFRGDGVVASTVSDESGSFAFPALPYDAEEGAVIEVSARWHSRFSAPLPPPGVLVLELVSRRRALVQRLFEWATKAGSPWVDSGEPTPGQIARIAERDQNGAIARWARATEEAAYGPNPPDDSVEEQVRMYEPGAASAHGERAH